MAFSGDITRNNIQEFISKIDSVSTEEFESVMNQIYDVLRTCTEGKGKHSENHSKEYYLDLLVDCYLQTSSERVFKILIGLPSPLNECLFSIILNKINSRDNLKNRQSVLLFISEIVHVAPAWLSQIINLNLLNKFFSILKNDEEVVILGTSALILVELIATLPSIMSQVLSDIFHFFARLSTFLYRKKQHNNDANSLQMHSIVYRFFLRLYAMYPCNFVHFLKTNYGIGCNKEHAAVFNKIIEPMLSQIRFHPLLITASTNKECDKKRWFAKESHDNLEECLKFVIDPIEFVPDSDFEANFADDNNVDDDELCQLADSLSDEETMHDNLSAGSYSPQPKLKTVGTTSGIFSTLNEEIASGSLVAPLGKPATGSYLSDSDSAKVKNDEFAEEAIFLSKENANFSVNTDVLQKFSPIQNNNSVVVPVAISALTKTLNEDVAKLERKISNGKQCFSPFKPIKEFDNSLSNDIEEVDMEVLSFSYLSSEVEKADANAGKRLCPKDTKERNPLNENLSILSKFKSENENDMSELIGNIKTSLKMAKSRIRYQSHCLPDTSDPNDFYSGANFSGIAFNLKSLSKSCPMLYFKSDDEIVESRNVASTQPKGHSCESTPKSAQTESSQINRSVEFSELKRRPSEDINASNKAKVSLMLDNPDIESKRMRRSLSLKQTCKSVDFSKEARQRLHRSDTLNSRRRDMFESTSSVDLPTSHRTDALNRKFTPHEMLDQILLINSNICRKELQDIKEGNGRVDVLESRLESRRNSAMNTAPGGSCSLLEFSQGASNTTANTSNYPCMTEEDMRNHLAFMHAQLQIERHQRDKFAIRNRRLYKRTKEFDELQKTVMALKEQLKQQKDEQAKLEERLTAKLYDFNGYRQKAMEMVDKLEDDLKKCKSANNELTSKMIKMEKGYREEIDSLNQNYRSTELELKKYVCTFEGKSVDLAKLEKENADLRNRLFVFGEFYTKLRDTYMQNKHVTTDLNDKLTIDSIKYDNEELSKQVHQLSRELSVYKNEVYILKDRLEKEKVQNSMKLESKDITYFKDLLRMKDEQIKSLKTTIINFDKHIHSLNGQLNACNLLATDDAKKALKH